MALSQNAKSVLNAVNTLYQNPNVQEKEKASFWLGEFQRSVFAWETADQLLHLKQDVESTYFAAQTMRTKILYSFRELPPDSHEGLKQSLLTHIEQLCGYSPALTTQLALAVCDLALQMPQWKVPALTFIEKYSKDIQALPYLLEILTVLPEEVNSRHLRLGANRRANIIEDMENSAPMVIEVVQACLMKVQDDRLLGKIFKCLGSWFYLGVFPGNHVARCKILDAPFQVLGTLSSSSSLHEAATDCVCSALYAAEDVARNQDLVQQLFSKTLALKQTYIDANANEDIDKCLNLCRIFTELAESLLEILVNMPGEGLGDLEILDILLMCVGHCQYEVADITFNYWYRLSEALYAFDHDIVHQIYSSFAERLIFALVRHCQMEPDHDTILDQADDFADFRNNSADLVKDIVYLVGPTECFIGLFKMLSGEVQTSDGTKQGVITWDVTESVLFMMTAIAKNVKATEVTVTPQVLQAIFSLPASTHIAVRHTSIQLVGELSRWIEKHPDLLNPTLQYLTDALQTKELSSVAATSVQYLCEVCQSQMIQHYTALIQLVQVADDLQVSSDATLGLLKGVSSVLSCLPTEKAHDALTELCRSQVIALSQISQKTTQEQHQVAKPSNTDPVTWLDRLAVIFRTFTTKNNSTNGYVHPCKPVIEEMWPILQSVLEQHKVENRIVERWCRCIRFAVRCVKMAIVTTLVPSLTSTLSAAYKSSPHSCFLYLGSVLVDEYGSDMSASNILLEMLEGFCPKTFEILNEEKGLQNHPDTVDDLFRLCCRFVERCPLKFLSHIVCPPLLHCALAAISLEHRDANTSVTKFLRNVIDSRVGVPGQPQDAAGPIMSMYGEEIVKRSLNASLFSLPSFLYPDIAELWWAVMQRNREWFKTWLEKSLKNLPSDATFATATHEQILQFLAEVTSSTECKNVSYLLRDFCRLYR